MLLGCIGDDFTGSSDLGNTLTRAGMRVTQYVGTPTVPAQAEVEAGIVALKSRSIPAEQAIRLSLEALEWLAAQGCRQYLFKYCSTFDSTPEGNIGPVAEALADRLGADRIIMCPAFPATGRSVYQGHLFVGDALLSESGMQNHPLTPMTDPDLRRVLAAQSKGSVGHISFSDIRGGVGAIRAALAREQAAGHRMVIADAIRDEDLVLLGRAAADRPLIGGGSGIALGLPDNFRAEGLISGEGGDWRPQPGPAAILSGSCSVATREQVARHRDSGSPAREIDVPAVMESSESAETLVAWAMAQDGVPLIYSSADPEAVRSMQTRFGRAEVSHRLEALMAEVARALVAAGVTRLVTAGGETSGAVVEGLDLTSLAIGPEIAPGVPAVRAGDALTLALKSGNFGGPDFFADAVALLGG
ncbi:3-oxo-tetronate kinase [Oceanibium sediminis]|uniref:3-oxo-tetronate kinase n=1 Tax=Oceanibium sediminis TaxID=2026339 RepID=UPI000DD49663|nr:3-oxo-tetronate kinase [Oceanibium sediminis]